MPELSPRLHQENTSGNLITGFGDVSTAQPPAPVRGRNMTDFSDMTTVNKLQFLVDEYEKGSWRRYGQVQDACREAIVALEQAQADIQEQHDDLIEETLRANTAEARIEQLEAALSAALDWSEAIEQGPFGDKRPDIARVEFHAFAKGLIDCSHLPNLRHLSSPSVEDTSND